MAFSFSDQDIRSISQTLQADVQALERSWYFRLANAETGQSLAITIHNDVRLDQDTTGSLITAQTQHGYFEIHDCSGFVVVEPDEIIFVSSNGDTLSSLVVGASCTCSLFANIRKSIINADFAQLDASILMAAMQLSLTEQVFA